MTAAPPHCSICRRRWYEHDASLSERAKTLDIGGPVSNVCLPCALAVADYILKRAGRARIWELDPKRVASATDLQAFIKGAISELQEDVAREVARPTLADFERAPPPSDPEDVAYAELMVLVDPLEALKIAAQVVLRTQEPDARIRALKVIFDPRLLKADGLDVLRTWMFRD